ncbi:MAG: protein translocase subunit SecDF [Sphingobacteriales bacterium]|nr:protein translocase subunit SecDF [Sphingobacteriales bacterium]
MQGKGLIRAFTILLLLICLYQLSFTFFANRWDKKADSYAVTFDSDKESAAYKNARRAYIDSIQNLKVINLGFTDFTYKQVKEQQLNLGLELQGGMNVVLQASLDDLIKSMANNSKDPNFLAALQNAKTRQTDAQEDYVTLFGQEYAKLVPGGNGLAPIFSASSQYQSRIPFNATDAQVLEVIRGESDQAVQRTYEVIKARIDRFGVAQPNVNLQPATGRIVVELPGVDDPERVRKLLQATAKLEFWETYEQSNDMMKWLNDANDVLKKKSPADSKSTAAATDSTNTATAAADSSAAVGDSTSLVMNDDSAATAQPDSTKSREQLRKENPFYAVFQPSNQVGPVIGFVVQKDTAALNKYLSDVDVKNIFPKNLKFLYGNKPQVVTNEDGNPSSSIYPIYAIKSPSVEFQPRLDGGYIVDSRHDFDINNDVVVNMQMNPEGANIWKKMTGENVGKFIAIALDDQIYSAPTVNQEIAGGNSQISGGFDLKEAEDLANILKVGKLPAPARIVEEAVVGPSLGEKSISAGLWSLMAAFLAIMVFMLAYYNNSGWVANVALLLNLFIIVGVLASLGATLTLPGMAGIVLTIGMAVDANVLIFERIREELAQGIPLRKAVIDGYTKSYAPIIDSNLTTLISAVVMLIFGLGPIKGFATILTIGIFSSLFTAVLLARYINEWAVNKNWNLKFSFPWSEPKSRNYKFLQNRKLAYTISIALIVVGAISMVVRGFDLGVDLRGGRTFVVQFDKAMDTDQVAGALQAQFEKAPLVRTYGSNNQFKITTDYKIASDNPETDTEVEQKLYEGVKGLYAHAPTFGDFHSKYKLSSQKVGPTIADDISQSAWVASILAAIGIFLYIFLRFRKWQFGLAAVLCMVHDALVILSLFSLLPGIMPFSMEIDQTFIAAILTILGYSVNDTVIVFDRIREYVKKYPKRDKMQLMNDAINTTLSRTIITSLVTFMVVFILFLFGGDTLKGFSFALMVGIVLGTLSSIFVAAPIVYDLSKGEALSTDENHSLSSSAERIKASV